MGKQCPTCKLCMTCGKSDFPHECPYPDCDKWHQCAGRTKESNASARSRARSEGGVDWEKGKNDNLE